MTLPQRCGYSEALSLSSKRERDEELRGGETAEPSLSLCLRLSLSPVGQVNSLGGDSSGAAV